MTTVQILLLVIGALIWTIISIGYTIISVLGSQKAETKWWERILFFPTLTLAAFFGMFR